MSLGLGLQWWCRARSCFLLEFCCRCCRRKLKFQIVAAVATVAGFDYELDSAKALSPPQAEFDFELEEFVIGVESAGSGSRSALFWYPVPVFDFDPGPALEPVQMVDYVAAAVEAETWLKVYPRQLQHLQQHP